MNTGLIAIGGQAIGGSDSSIIRFEQTPIFTSSITINHRAGAKRIEALLCGGGGGGGSGCGGGFGGLAVLEIPVTGQPLQITIGAGGAGGSSGARGGTTTVSSAGTILAAVGGGGGGNNSGAAINGSYGGGGGAANSLNVAGCGGCPPLGRLIWSPQPGDTNGVSVSNSNTQSADHWGEPAAGAGRPGRLWRDSVSTTSAVSPSNGSMGGGGGGSSTARSARRQWQISSGGPRGAMPRSVSWAS